MEFSLRPWKFSDLDSLVEHANNINIAKFMTDKFTHPYTKETGEAFITFATKDDPIRMFAIEVNGEAVGGIGIHPKDDIERMNAELGYWLAEPFWGRGVMSSAVKQMIDYGFKTFPIDRIYARRFGTNMGSQKVMERAGLVFECRFEKTLYKNGEFVDEFFYAIRREQAVI